MASSFPPNCSRVMRSCSCCFCVLSSFARFSMARFSHQREKRIHPTTNTTTTRAAEVYSVGFLKKGLDGVSGSADMVTPKNETTSIEKIPRNGARKMRAQPPLRIHFLAVPAFARGGLQFIVGEAEVNHKFRNPWLQIFEGGRVELGPLVRCDGGSDRNCMVDDDIGRAQSFFEIKAIGEPVAGNEDRKLVVVSDSNDDFEQIFAVIE